MRWRIARFACPLRTPGILGTAGPLERVGFHVELHDGHGVVGRGEASPAYWIEGTDLESLASELRGFAAASNPERVVACIAEGSPLSLSAAASAGVETAVLDLVARQRGCSVAELLGGPAETQRDTSALIGGDTAEAIHETTLARVREGFGVVKLKVGGRPVADDVARIRAALSATGGAARLRLDANRAWNYPTALSVLGAVAHPDIQLIEEPLRDSPPDALARLRRATGVPVAVDESVLDRESLTLFADRGACDMVVLKLARLGGPRAALALARRARDLGLGVIWTDSIESVVGRQATLHAAAADDGPPAAVGLGGEALLVESGVASIRARVRIVGPGLGPPAAAP